jgi:hypothetical protein
MFDPSLYLSFSLPPFSFSLPPSIFPFRSLEASSYEGFPLPPASRTLFTDRAELRSFSLRIHIKEPTCVEVIPPLPPLTHIYTLPPGSLLSLSLSLSLFL